MHLRSRFSFPAPARRLLIIALVALALPFVGLSGASAAPANGMFVASRVWRGEFADPSILRVGNTFYAYATVTGGDNLPIAHSSNLNNWFARSAYPSNANPGWWRGYNDGMPHPARWARYNIWRNGRRFTSPWAPSVAQVGNHFVAAYSVPPVGGRPNRRCVSIATSNSPVGPFVDRSSGPIECSSDPNGSNDPQVFRASSGAAYLIWKNAGVPGSQPTRLWSRLLNRSGTGFAPRTANHPLLSTASRWEGNVIENPAMIQYAGRFYLFYSGNGFATANYAIGYAICNSPMGGCHRPSRGPLLTSGGSIAGPGGPAPVVGLSGALRLGYAAWNAGHVGYGNPANHRRLHIARLSVGRAGLLRVVTRG